MVASLACLQARIDTFAAPATSRSRRTSSKSKKAPPKAKNAWPLEHPSPHDLAFAGFVWKPTTASPDNVQCFSCHCQLDGWEENDVPAYEHITHSPSCGFAVVTCIRLRSGDPDRNEDDPISDAMMQARRDTFGDSWPLDSNEGFPSIEQVKPSRTQANCKAKTCSWWKLVGIMTRHWTLLTVPPAHTALSL